MPKPPTPAAIRKAVARLARKTTDLAGRLSAATLDLAKLEHELLRLVRKAKKQEGGSK